MTLKNWMTFKSIVCIVFAIGFVLVPVPLVAIFGAKLDPAGALFAQFLGCSFVVLAVYLWFARNVAEGAAAYAIVLAVTIGDAIGLIVSLIGVLSGVFNALGWLIVLLYLVLTLGFGYFWLVRPVHRVQTA